MQKAATTAVTVAIRLIELYIAEHENKDTHAVLIVSDSLSLEEALQGDPYRLKQDTIRTWRTIQSVGKIAKVAWVWVSSHCGLMLTDAADKLAAKGCLKD